MLTVHGISDNRINSNELSTKVFTNLIEYLLDNKYEFYKVHEYTEIIKNPNAICLTFDDGSYSNYILAKDYLTKKHIPATFFIPTIIFDDERVEVISSNYENGCMREYHVKELHEMGYEIGCHSHSHKVLSKMSINELSEDIKKCKDIVENLIESSVVSFAYPYGHINSYSKLTKEIISNNGFNYICTQSNNKNDDKLEIPRIGIDGRDTLNIIKNKIQGKNVLLNKMINERLERDA